MISLIIQNIIKINEEVEEKLGKAHCTSNL